MNIILYDFMKDNDVNHLILDYVNDLKLMDKVKNINQKITFFKYKKLYVLNSLFHDKLINFIEFAEADHDLYIPPSIIQKYNRKHKCKKYY